MRISLLRCTLVALLTVGLSGCYSNGRWSMPNLNPFKSAQTEAPFDSSVPDLRNAQGTPSEYTYAPNSPGPGNGYNGLSNMATPTYPETPTSYDPSSGTQGSQWPAHSTPGQGTQYSGAPGAATPGYNSNNYAAGAAAGGFVAPQQGLYGSNASNQVPSSTYYPNNNTPFVNGQSRAALGTAPSRTVADSRGAIANTNYADNNYNYSNPVRSGAQYDGQAGQGSGAWDNYTNRNAAAGQDYGAAAPRSTNTQLDYNRGLPGSNYNTPNYNTPNYNTPNYNTPNYNTPNYNTSTSNNSGYPGAATPRYDSDKSSWNTGSYTGGTADDRSAIAAKSAAAPAGGYSSSPQSPRVVDNPYAGANSTTGQPANDYSYPSTPTSGNDYGLPKTQSADRSPSPTGTQPGSFRPGSVTSYSSTPASTQYPNYSGDTSTVYPANTAGSSLRRDPTDYTGGYK